MNTNICVCTFFGGLTQRLTIGLLGSLLLAACGSDQIPESQKVHHAPHSQNKVGVVVSGLSEPEAAQLVQSHPELSVRLVNPAHNLFEFFGANETQLRELIQNKNVAIEKNKFIKAKKFATDSAEKPVVKSNAQNPLLSAIENNMQVTLQGLDREFVSSCKLNKLLGPNVEIEDNLPLDKTQSLSILELGHDITFNSTKSKSKNETPGLTSLFIVQSPNDSLLEVKTKLSLTFAYTPDSTGIYLAANVIKDSAGFCTLGLHPFLVTANDAYDPKNAMPNSRSQQINPKTFWHIFHIGAEQSWTKAAGAGRLIAILDTGVNYNHPALAANIRINPNEIAGNHIDDDKNGFVDDVYGYDLANDDEFPFDDAGHGSHVAGIAASHLFGAARDAQILPVKVGSEIGFDMASVAGGIRYAVDQGANVINMSFDSHSSSSIIEEAIAYAESKNVLLVVAAGNETSNNDIVGSFPANFSNANIISVAATDENDLLTNYSNFGSNVHIAAPGGAKNVPLFSSYKKNARGIQMVGYSGTSMASPLVAGAAAQIWSAQPQLTAVHIKQILLETGRPIESLKDKILSGRVIDVVAALNKIIPPSRVKPAEVSFTTRLVSSH